MKTDIVLQDNSVEVTGKLIAKDGAEVEGHIQGKSITLKGGPLNLRDHNSAANIFYADRIGQVKIGSNQNPGFVQVRGPENSSFISSSRCETEEVIGNKSISVGKPQNLQEGSRTGIDGRLSVYAAESQDAQVEILGKTGDIRMAGSIRPTGDSPMMYVHELGAYPRHPQGRPIRSQHPPRQIIAHSPQFKEWGLAYNDHSDSFDFQRDGKAVLRVNLKNKRIGIGTENPDHHLHVNGTIAATEPFRNLSDSRCKDIHGEIEDALAKVQSLRGVRFRWKTNCSPMNTKDRDHLGIIAQEVEKVLPEVVSVGESGKATVAYSELIPVLIEALKDEARERQQLEERLQVVENLVQNLMNSSAETHQTSKV